MVNTFEFRRSCDDIIVYDRVIVIDEENATNMALPVITHEHTEIENRANSHSRRGKYESYILEKFTSTYPFVTSVCTIDVSKWRWWLNVVKGRLRIPSFSLFRFLFFEY